MWCSADSDGERERTGSKRWGRRTTARQSWLAAAATALGLAALLCRPSPAGASQTCEDFDHQCMTDGVCQANGDCVGTPKSNGTPCDDGSDCTLNDQCLAGHCVGAPAQDGTTCSSLLGPCMTNPHCFQGFCFGDIVECPSGSDLCQVNVCDPHSGQCVTFNNTCDDQCASGQCDSKTGACLNMQPKPDGLSCDDGKDCTSNDGCQAGACVGGAASGTPPIATATPAATLVAPSPTATETPLEEGSPTAIPMLPLPCIGDCNASGDVTVNEIIIGVNIALGNTPISACAALDSNNDGEVTVNEIIGAVNAVLNGCPIPPTPTPETEITPTSGPASPTPTTAVDLTATPTAAVTTTAAPSVTEAAETPTPTAIGATGTPTPTAVAVSPTPTASAAATPTGGSPTLASRAAGTIESTTTAFLIIPDMLSALLGHLPGSGSGSGGVTILSVPFSCPNGGGGQLSCDQSFGGFPPSFSPPVYTATLNSCKTTSSTGAVLTFDGSLTATGQPGDFCGTIPETATLNIQNLTVQSQSAAGSTTATFTDVTAGLTAACSGDSCACTFDTVTLDISGTLAVVSKDAQGAMLSSMQVAFGNGTTISISVNHFAAQCVPDIYTMQIDGAVGLTTNDSTVQTTLVGYTVHDDATSGQDVVQLSGSITSACLGGTAQLSTLNDIIIGPGVCPQSGAVEVSSDAGTDSVTYVDGSVQIDLGEDGSVDQSFDSCLDPRLLMCAES